MPLKMTNESDLTASTLRRLLQYNPVSGVFTWKTRGRDDCSCDQGWKMFNRRYPGTEAGCLDPHNDYVKIKLGGRQFMAHRLACLYMTGEFPAEQVDHINGRRYDNRYKNLRMVSCVENRRNLSIRSNNVSGCTGVSWPMAEGFF